MSATITVSTREFRQALISVSPHQFPKPDFPSLHRVRLTLDRVNLSVTATNRYTAALAVASLEDAFYSDEGEPYDLSPNDVTEILALFKGGGGSGSAEDEQPDDRLEIAFNDSHLIVTDVSGLIPGKSLKLPRFPVADDFPNIHDLVRNNLTARRSRPDRTVVAGKLLTLFGAASKTYGGALAIESGERNALVISCGDSFVGLLMPHKLDPEHVAELDEWRDGWLRRLRAGELVSVG